MSNRSARQQPMPKGQLGWDLAAPPEWEIAQRSIQASQERDPAAWTALATCPAIEVYTDGSAPIRNPGGDSGFAAVFVGFAAPTDPIQAIQATALARADVGGYLPARTTDPPTSNNRAEIAGVLAALAGLRAIWAMEGCTSAARVWSDSEYTIQGALGRQQRRKNTDLWPLMDRLLADAEAAQPGGVALEWVRGHAGNRYNEAADELSTRAAFNFDDAQVARYRTAQAATGQEMPGAAALARHGVTGPAPAQSPVASPTSGAPADPPSVIEGSADYTIALHMRLEGGGLRGPAIGQYRLTTRAGRSRLAEVRHAEPHAVDEAEYHTLVAALTDLIARITAAGREPSAFTLAVHSQQEVVVNQLTGVYRVKAPALQAPYAAVRDLLARFGHVELVWRRADELKGLFGG